MKNLTLSLAIVSLLAACGPKEVPQDVVDNNMTVTRLNAQKNANSWFSISYPEGTEDAKLGKPMRVLMQSDSSVTKFCRNGDGWASGNVQFVTGRTLSLKCQTNGTGKGINGCMTNSEFETKTYKNEEGKCQNLPSLEKM